MKLEVLRAIADELTDPVFGVNALLPLVPRDDGDAEPPAIVGIYEESRTGWVASGEVPKAMRAAEQCPFLVVTIPGDVNYGGRSRPTNAAIAVKLDGLPVTVQYVTHDSLTERGQQNALYTMRAVRSVIQRFASSERASARQRNGVQLEVLQSVLELEGFEPIDDKVSVSGIVATTWTVRETSY